MYTPQSHVSSCAWFMYESSSLSRCDFVLAMYWSSCRSNSSFEGTFRVCRPRDTRLFPPRVRPLRLNDPPLPRMNLFPTPPPRPPRRPRPRGDPRPGRPPLLNGRRWELLPRNIRPCPRRNLNVSPPPLLRFTDCMLWLRMSLPPHPLPPMRPLP